MPRTVFAINHRENEYYEQKQWGLSGNQALDMKAKQDTFIAQQAFVL